MDVRRSARVATSFLVAVQGVDREVVLRRGNMSTTGVYFVTESDVGDVGMMTWLTLSSIDRARTILVMAYVVRSVRRSDIDGRDLTGVAFEFIPENATAAAAVQEFVEYVLSLRRDIGASHAEARAETPAAAAASAQAVRSIVLDTDWAVAPGEIVYLEIFAPGMPHRIRLAARAVRVSQKTGDENAGVSGKQIELSVEEQREEPLRSLAPPSVSLAMGGMNDAEVSDTVDDLLEAVIAPQSAALVSRPTHLVGVLSQIALPTLLSIVEMEQLTGKLVVRTVGGDATFLFAREGKLVDVEPLGRFSGPRERLASILMLAEGSFEFYDVAVDRPDRIGARTTALLLDLMRLADEATRDDDVRT